jgi:transposase-like protein
MNLKEINKKYGTQEKCLSLLKKLRWGKTVKCPYCGSDNIYDYENQAHRYKCYNCNKSFSILVGTIFEDTKLPLPDWFLITSLILQAKSGMSASELARHLDLPLKTTWLAAMKLRCAMIDKKTQLHGVLEMDESYFASSHKLPKETSKSAPILSRVYQKRGRGTTKVSVVGITKKGGNVKTKVIEKLTTRNLMAMLLKYAKTEDSVLITDGFRSYDRMNEVIEHLQVRHKDIKKGSANVNQIEGYWGYVKNGLRGSFKSISRRYLPFYLVEFEYKYNRRNKTEGVMQEFLKSCLTDESCMLNYKPKKDTKEVVYG